MLGEFFIGFFAGKSPLHGAFLPTPSIRPRIRLALQTFAARLLPSTVVFHRYCGPWPGCPARAHAQLGRRVTVQRFCTFVECLLIVRRQLFATHYGEDIRARCLQEGTGRKRPSQLGQLLAARHVVLLLSETTENGNRCRCAGGTLLLRP